MKRQRRLLAFLIVSGAVLGLFGPYGTYQALGTPQRMAFWILTVTAIGGVTVAIRRVGARWLEPRFGFWPVLIGACVMSTVIGASMLRVALPIIIPGSGAVVSLAALLGQVLLVTALLTALALALEHRGRSIPEPAPALARGDAPSPWRQRLPAALRDAELLALEAEDHYLRVHTVAGSTLILLRLSDAMAELGPEAGAQVHRSFWVARGAVASIQRDNGRPSLILKGGLKVPVSRGHQAKIKAMGWDR
jgi:hypothetical protein